MRLVAAGGRGPVLGMRLVAAGGRGPVRLCARAAKRTTIGSQMRHIAGLPPRLTARCILRGHYGAHYEVNVDKDRDLVSWRRILLGLALAGPLVEPRGEDAQEARHSGEYIW